ncbi:UTP--glucose-1-phosphate uridylyltransferase [bacterium BMS3Abin14]|nr:UTP--glucose-1-phosphate uridylyltransferase [bacterium BMS3Abin14]
MRIRKAVIPVAGMGTRFLPITKSVPKEMLPLLDRPVIQEIVEETVRSGVRNIVLVTGMGKSSIEDYFDISPHLESFLAGSGRGGLLERVRDISRFVEIASVRQKEPKGLGHAILCARNLIGNEPFGVLLGDDLIDSDVPCLSQLIHVFEKVGRTVIALQRVPQEDVGHYGIIEGEMVEPGLYRVSRLVEKPSPGEAPSNLAVIGRYILPPGIFGIIDSLEPGAGGEIQLTDALDKLAADEGVFGLVFDGLRHDTGNLLGFLSANIHYALKDPDLGPRLRSFIMERLKQGDDP